MDYKTVMENKVVEYLDASTSIAIDLLRRLVRIPSAEGTGEVIIPAVAKLMRELGADMVDEFLPDIEELRSHPGYSPVHPEHSSTAGGEAPVVVGRFDGLGGGRSLMFYGHMTSGTPAWEPAVVAKMRFDPWGAVVQDGRLYGRGAYNMKAGNAAGLVALQAIRSVGIRLRGDVLFGFNSDEDVGSNGALATVLRGYTADAGINPEPTSLWICPSTGGPMWFRLEVVGRSAFGGWEVGVNAIDKAILVYEAIKEYAGYRKEEAHHPLYDGLVNAAPLGVGVFRAGNWPSNTPEVVIIEGRIGCLPGEDLETIRSEFEGRIARVESKDAWLREHPVKVIWTARWEPVMTDPTHPIVQTACDVYRSVVGEEPTVSGKTAGNDMTKFTLYGGMPSINWGAGGGPFGHRKASETVDSNPGFDEYVSLDSFHTLVKLFAVTLIRWCDVDGG